MKVKNISFIVVVHSSNDKNGCIQPLTDFEFFSSFDHFVIPSYSIFVFILTLVVLPFGAICRRQFTFSRILNLANYPLCVPCHG